MEIEGGILHLFRSLFFCKLLEIKMLFVNRIINKFGEIHEVDQRDVQFKRLGEAPETLIDK